VGLLLLLGCWGFAQGGGVSGFVKERADSQGISGVIITVKEASSDAVTGAGTTDASGYYSVVLPSFGDFRLLATKIGYDDVPAPHGFRLSDGTPQQTINLFLDRKAWLKGLPQETGKVLSWETGTGKSYVIPALEIPAFLLLLNGYDRYAFPDAMEGGKKTYSSNLSTFRDHVLHGHWLIDNDSFAINQLGHPYQGTISHGFARSAGLNYWEALLYDNTGSLLWEMGGETTPPSYNDQIASGIGGSFFGEALFRMSNLLLEGADGEPGFWRKLGATALSPSAGLNRFAYGNRFKPVFPSYDPATFWRLRFGANLTSHLQDEGISSSTIRDRATADYSMAYGLPGKDGYSYERPFDYFQFEFTSLGHTDNPIDNVMIRGLLLGKDYEAGDSFQGIWGLYGGYDYISPYIFRVSSTSLSLGTTYQWWLSRRVALQGSVLGGVGFAAAGNISPVGERDYHYGFAPQGLIALRLLFGNSAMFDLTDRAFSVTGQGSDNPGGRESINRLNAGLTVRIHGRHAIGIQYIGSTRNAHYPSRVDSHQKIGTVALVYTLLGASGFGAVK
jgi:hypothetical protein